MVSKKNTGDILFDSFNTILLLLLVVITLYPFVHIVSASFSDSNLLMAHEGLLLWPKRLNLDAYKMVLFNPNILSGYKVTLFVVIVGTSFNILMTSLGAYVLSRKQFAIKKAMMVMIIITMYFNGGLIPRYLLIYKTLNLGNSLLALILPTAIMSWNLIIMRTNFMAMPAELEESAKIDGANDLTILFRIIMPLAKPIIAVMVLFYGVHHWNAWFDAMIFIRERALYPLQLILREILVSNAMDDMMNDVSSGDQQAIGESIKHATTIIATVPILLVYPFVQKYFVKGMMIGALKG